MSLVYLYHLSMFGIFHAVQLMPQQVNVSSQSGRFSRAVPATTLEVRCEAVVEDTIEWTIFTLRELLARNSRSGKLHIVFSDTWVRYDLFSLGGNDLGDADAVALAHVQFANLYPAAANWKLRVAQQGDQLLVAGINPVLFTSIDQVMKESGCRLVRLEPWFTKIIDKHKNRLAKSDEWLLFDEPGMMIVALLKGGLLISMHCHPCENGASGSVAQTLLNRQSAVLGHPPGAVHIFSFSGIPFDLQVPWVCVGFNMETPAENRLLGIN